MKVLDQTDTRLVLKLGVPLLNYGTCVFDRAAGTATISAHMFVWPRTRTVPLEEIEGVELYRDGASGKKHHESYCPALRLSSGRWVFLPGFRRKSCAAAVERIRAFLSRSPSRHEVPCT